MPTRLITSELLNSLYCSFLTTFNSAIANQESLSSLEVEMRKLEGITKEIVEEMGYLKKREERFAATNCTLRTLPSFAINPDTNGRRLD